MRFAVDAALCYQDLSDENVKVICFFFGGESWLYDEKNVVCDEENVVFDEENVVCDAENVVYDEEHKKFSTHQFLQVVCGDCCVKFLIQVI